MKNIQVLQDIYSTKRNSVQLTVSEAPRERILPWESNFGGSVYLPESFDYPLDDRGSPLSFLAQINFSEMPSLDLFPKDGVLQFYIGNDDAFGAWSENYKVIYIPKSEIDSGSIRHYDFERDEIFPIETSMILTGKKTNKPIPTLNPFFKKCFEQYVSDKKNETNFFDLYISLIDDFNSHQIGGYASFVQDEPAFFQDNDTYEVLLQIDSDNNIVWGDSGIATFLIEKEALSKKDFSKAIFYWNCC